MTKKIDLECTDETKKYDRSLLSEIVIWAAY